MGSIVSNSIKREGDVAIRSSGGMPILDETYYYLVVGSSKSEAYLSIINTPGLPLVNTTVSPSGYGICKTKSAKQREANPIYWDVTCHFSSEVDERQNNQDPATDPVTWVPIYETKFERLQEIVTKDLNNKAVANSAGQPFEVGLTIGRFIPVWEFFQLESGSITDEQMADRNETINSSTFKGKPAKTLLLTIMSSVVGFYYGQRRRLTQYSIKYNKRKWKHKRLDVGTVYLEGTFHLPYLDKDGNVMLGGLNGAGLKVAVGDPPATLEFDIYDDISFSFLRI